jgi:hypothetical protein
MEINMADQKVTAPNQLGQLQGILDLIGGGGTTATTRATNTAPLQGVLANLQGIDYNALLQSIFQQAAGQIPGLNAAYANAVGARSSGNAPMQAALQDLLKTTALEGQKQVATQQNQNLQTQAQAAANLRGTTATTAKNSQLGQAAALIGLLQGATKLGGFKTVQEMLGAVSGTGAAPATGAVGAQSVAPTYQIAPMDYPSYDMPVMQPMVQPVADVPMDYPNYDMPAIDTTVDMPAINIQPEAPAYDFTQPSVEDYMSYYNY